MAFQVLINYCMPGDGSGWQYCSVQDKEAHSPEKADVNILRASWSCAAGDFHARLFSNMQQFISFSARLFGSHLMEPASMKVTLRRALTWRYISRIAPGFGTYAPQDGDTIEVFQQQSGGSWGGREGSACCCLFEKSNPPLRCSVRALSILSL